MAIILLLFVLIVIILSIPAVQTAIAKRVTNSLNESYGIDINIDRVGLNWKGQVDVRGVFIADHHKDTLIYSKRLNTTILNIGNLFNDDFDFGPITLTEAKFHHTTYLGEDQDNLTVFIEKFENDNPPSGVPFQLSSNHVRLIDSELRIVDENLTEPTIAEFKDLTLDVSEFNIYDDDVRGEINSLVTSTDFGFNIRDLQGDFNYSDEGIRINTMNLSTDHSNLIGDVFLDGSKGMSDFENQVEITARMDQSIISTNDLNSFYNEFGPNQLIKVSGDLKGTLNDFRFNNASLALGNSLIRGNLSFKNVLSDPDSIEIVATNHTINTNYYDLRRLLPNLLGSVLPEEMKTLGSFTLRGNTRLSGDQITTTSALSSRLGTAGLDVEIGNFNDFDNAFYSGDVVLENFDLGTLTNTTSLETITADLTIDGRGFTQKTVNTRISGSIPSFVFEGYNYQNISVKGSLKDPVFNGRLSINDENLKMSFNGLVDVSKDFNQYDFEADVEFAELNQLNLFTRDSVAVFAGRIIMDMDGTTVDNAEGTIEFVETFYQNEDDDFYFDDFLVISSFEKDIRTIEIKSPDIIDGKISGQFLVEDLPNLFRNGVGSIYANYIPNEVTTDQYIDYEFEVYNKIVEVFVPQLKLGENTRVSGSVSSDESKFKLNFKSPEIVLYDRYLEKINIQVDNNNPVFNTYISVDSVDTGFYSLTDVSLINKTLNDTLYIQTEFKGGRGQQDIFDLSLYHTINQNGKSVVGMKKSDITYKDNVWTLNEENNRLNKVVFDDNFNEIRIDSLVLSHQNEAIRLAGLIRGDNYKDVKVRFDDVNLDHIVPPVDSLKLAGNINGRLNFLQQEEGYFPTANVTIDGVEVNRVPFGNLNLKIQGNNDLSKYSIDSKLINDRLVTFNAEGEIDVSGKTPQIDLNVNLADFNLAAASPFGGEVVTDIRGLASGSARIFGNYDAPNITGRLTLQESGLKIPYLNTDFDIADDTPVYITKDEFTIATTTLTDTKYDTEGTFAGKVLHTNFGDWRLDFDISTDRMIVLDTPPDEDELYYGTAFISGTADISGPIDELVINANATTERGTSFKIPISDAESIGDDSFVHFISPEEKQALISGETIVSEEVKGLSLNFDLDINEEAEVEVLVDQENNSTLKGRGAGTLLLRINTQGKFDMWGDFLIIEGSYDFRYQGLVQKQFDVIPGGSITWDGIPTKARLDLTAKYTTSANPAVLLDNPTANRKIPVEVLIDLTGEIAQPELDFGIEFPGASSSVKSELEYKLQNKEQRELQALYLVSSGSFQGETVGQNALASTLAERVNSLVADIFTEEDSKFSVLPYYVPGSRDVNQQTADQLGVQLSTNISERIIINGRVGVPVGGVNESTVAGDIEVQWLVNEDGSLRMSFFNRQADIQFIGEDQIFEQGAGVSYSVDFNTFKELMDKLFNKKVELAPLDEKDVKSEIDTGPVNFINKKKN